MGISVGPNTITDALARQQQQSSQTNTLKDIISYKEVLRIWKIKKSYMWKVAKQRKTFISMSLGPPTVTAYFVHFLLNWIVFFAMNTVTLEYMPLYNYLLQNTGIKNINYQWYA